VAITWDVVPSDEFASGTEALASASAESTVLRIAVAYATRGDITRLAELLESPGPPPTSQVATQQRTQRQPTESLYIQENGSRTKQPARRSQAVRLVRPYLSTGGKPIGTKDSALTAVRRGLACAASVLAMLAISCLGSPVAAASSRPSTVPQAAPPATASSVRVVGPVDTDPQRDLLDFIQAVGVLAAFVGLVLIYKQLRSAEKGTRRERAAEVSNVWMDRDFRKLLSPVWSFLEVQGPEDCMDKIKAWVSAPDSETPVDGLDGRSVMKNDVNHILSVAEDLAARYNSNAIDRDWVERVLGPALVSMVDRCFWFLVFFRAHEHWETMGFEMEMMVRDLRETLNVPNSPFHPLRTMRLGHKRRRQQQQGTYREITRASVQKARIICLPPNPTTASAEDWLQAKNHALSLAVDQSAIHGYARSTGTTPSHPHAAAWRAIVIPESIDCATDAGYCEQCKELSDKLDGYLNSLPLSSNHAS
jgi:hypothetical protein